MTALLRYDAACRAIAEARAIDEVKEILDKAAAVELYARQAKDRNLEADVAAIRFRAERRIGQLEIELRAEGRLHQGGRPWPKNEADEAVTGNKDEPVKLKLADLGVDKRLSARAQQIAALPDKAFETILEGTMERVRAGEGHAGVALLKEKQRQDEREVFAQRTAQGCTVADLDSLIARGLRFGAILADPPSQFETYSELGGDRAARRHYQTDGINAIMALPVTKLAADNCLLALWTSGPHLQHALAYIDAWGFTYKTIGFDWMKLNPSGAGLFMGPGYWTRANAEIVLFATRGHPRRLDAGVMSAILEPVGEHSRKPDDVHVGLERLVAGPYLELYGRRQRDNWTVWGNEIGREALVVPEAAPTPAKSAWLAEGRRMRVGGARYIDIANAFGLSPSTVHEALNK